MKLSGIDFTKTLVLTFPDLNEEIEEWDGLLHVQMGTFTRFTQNAIEQGDIVTMEAR